MRALKYLSLMTASLLAALGVGWLLGAGISLALGELGFY